MGDQTETEAFKGAAISLAADDSRIRGLLDFVDELSLSSDEVRVRALGIKDDISREFGLSPWEVGDAIALARQRKDAEEQEIHGQ